MTLVYFIYGLAFFTLGVTILLYPKKKSSFPLAKDLHLIGFFGIFHGLSEWAELYALAMPDSGSLLPVVLDGALQPISYFFLLLFGTKVLGGPSGGGPALRLLAPGLLLIYLVLMVFFRDVCPGRDVWERYILGFPGIILTGLALQGQVRQFARLRLVPVLVNFKIAAIAFYVYAGLTLFANCRGQVFPFSLLSSQVFLEATGIPVQVLRTLCALAITYALIRMLEIFDWETREALRQAQDGLEQMVHERTVELMQSKVALQAKVDEHKETVRSLSRSTEALMTKQRQLRRLASELSLTEARERRRIASLLYDRVGPTLSVARTRTGLLAKALAGTGHDPALQEVVASLDESIELTRALVADLCPPILHEQGLVAALEWLAGQFRAEYGIECRCLADGRDIPLAIDLSALLFRFTRELLVNVVKHAEAGRADIVVSLDKAAGREVAIRVTDNGKGMDESRASSLAKNEYGFGLFNIRERINYLGGDFRLESQPGQGTSVTMTMPF